MFYPLHNCGGYLRNTDCLICTNFGSPYAVRWVVPALALCVLCAAHLNRGYLCRTCAALLASWAICEPLSVSFVGFVILAPSAPSDPAAVMVEVSASVTVTASTAQGLRVTISCPTIAPFPAQHSAMSPHIALDSAHQSPHCHHFASNSVQRVGAVTLTPCQRLK